MVAAAAAAVAIPAGPGSVLVPMLLLALLLTQRAIELHRARHHTASLARKGAIEHGSAHYPLLVAAHVVFYALWTVEVIARRPPTDAWTAAWLALFVAIEVGRLWTTATLGERWTTRIVIRPGLPPVRRGPYRVLRHPNYAIVVAEIATLAIAFRAWATMLIALALQAIVLTIRVRAENRAWQSGGPSTPPRVGIRE